MAAQHVTANLRREKFIDEYFRNGYNAQAAARAVGYASVAKSSHNLMKSEIVQRAIALKHKEMQLRNGITIDRIIIELSKIAFFDISKIYDENGRLRPIHLIEADARAAIAGVESEDLFGPDGIAFGILRKVKIVDRVRAMELLAKLLGFSERLTVDVPAMQGATRRIIFEDLSRVPEPPITPHTEIKSLPDASD